MGIQNFYQSQNFQRNETSLQSYFSSKEIPISLSQLVSSPRKGVGVGNYHSSNGHSRIYSPLLLQQQIQSYPTRNQQKSPLPSKNIINKQGQFDIKINKITNPHYNQGPGNSIVIDASPQQMNRKLMNIFETHSYQKNTSAIESKKDDFSIYSPAAIHPGKINKNEIKRVLIRQGLQGDINSQMAMLLPNPNQSVQITNKQNYQAQLKGLNQSMDLSIIPNNNSIIQESLAFKSHREKNAVLPSSNIKTLQKIQDDNEKQKDYFKKEKNYNNSQKYNINSSSKKIYTHQSSISCDLVNNKLLQNNSNLVSMNADTLITLKEPQQIKVKLQFEQVTPRQITQQNLHESSQLQLQNENGKQLSKVFSKTKSQFEQFSEQFIMRSQANLNAEQNFNLRNSSQNHRNRSQKQSPNQKDGRQMTNSQEFEFEQRILQQKYDSKDYLPLHLKILEEYQNDTLVKKDSSPPLPSCQITIQKTQLAKKYQLFLRNQKNKSIIAQKSSLTPQKLPNNKSTLSTNETSNLLSLQEKLPEIKQFNQISDKIAELYGRDYQFQYILHFQQIIFNQLKQQIDFNRKDSGDKIDLNLNIRKLDTETDALKIKRNKVQSNSLHQEIQRKHQKPKFSHNAERYYKMSAKSQMQNFNNRMNTEQLNQSQTDQNNYSNYLYTDEFNDIHLDDVSATNGIPQELSSVSILDAKNTSELNIQKLLKKQKISQKQQNLNILTTTPNLLPNQISLQSQNQLNPINLLSGDEKTNNVQINNRKSQRLLQFLQLQSQQQQIQYVQQSQVSQQYQPQYQSQINNQSTTVGDYLNLVENSVQITHPINGQNSEVTQNQAITSENNQNNFPQLHFQPEQFLKKKILRPRNLSGISPNLNRQSPRKAIQVSRVDLSSNARDQIYYSLNTSENFIYNKNNLPSSDVEILGSQKQSEIKDQNLMNISKTVNTSLCNGQEDRYVLQQNNKSLILQQSQSQINENNHFLQHIPLNQPLVQLRFKNKYNPRKQDISHTESGFTDDTNNNQSIFNGFNIEDYVSQMKELKTSQEGIEYTQKKQK